MTVNQSVVFRCANEEYAVPVEQVVSIEKVSHITPIPHLPNYLKGFTKIREELVPVIDFNQILYNQASEGDLSRIIVLKTDVINYGLVVSEAKEIYQFAEADIKQVGLVNYSKTKYFSGVANLENRMITCVDPEILVNSLAGIREIIEYLHEMLNENVNA